MVKRQLISRRRGRDVFLGRKSRSGSINERVYGGNAGRAFNNVLLFGKQFQTNISTIIFIYIVMCYTSSPNYWSLLYVQVSHFRCVLWTPLNCCRYLNSDKAFFNNKVRLSFLVSGILSYIFLIEHAAYFFEKLYCSLIIFFFVAMHITMDFLNLKFLIATFRI